MKYYLMHLDDKVMSLEIDPATATVTDYKVLLEERKPTIIDNLAGMRSWWKNRAIPNSRAGIQKILSQAGIETTEKLMLQNLALNLSDCYWVQPADSSLKWKEVNFYENNFEKVSLTTIEANSKNALVSSPSSTLNGEMPKYWCIREGKRILVKEAIDFVGRHQCANEAFAASLHNKQGRYSCVNYLLNRADGVIKSVSCPQFTSLSAEFIPLGNTIPASQLSTLDVGKLKRNFSDGLESLNIPKTVQDNYFAYLHLIDFLISNTDRHLNNYGIIRNPNTLETLGFAPIFDNGNSMLYRGTIQAESFEFLALKTKTTGIYSSEHNSLQAATLALSKICWEKLPSSNEVFDFYKDSLGTAFDAERIANAYAFKVDVASRLRDGENLHSILKNPRAPSYFSR